MLFIGNATAMSGISHYFNDIVMDEAMAPLGFISLLSFSLLVVICEFFYRIANSKDDMIV